MLCSSWCQILWVRETVFCSTTQIFLLLIDSNRPIQLTQCCTQFKFPRVKILCVLCLHYNVAFTFTAVNGMEIPETKCFIPKDWVQQWVSRIGLLKHFEILRSFLYITGQKYFIFSSRSRWYQFWRPVLCFVSDKLLFLSANEVDMNHYCTHNLLMRRFYFKK